jgi:hypothetical protein
MAKRKKTRKPESNRKTKQTTQTPNLSAELNDLSREVTNIAGNIGEILKDLDRSAEQKRREQK